MKRLTQSEPSAQRTFKYYALRWLDEARLNLKDSSLAKYRNVITLYILPAFGKTRLCDFNTNKIEAFTSKLLTSGGARRKGLQPSTVNTVLAVMRKIIEFTAQETDVPRLSFRKLRVCIRRSRSRVLTAEEQKTLWRYLRADSSQCSLGVLLCLAYGLRTGEICALRWGDVDLDGGIISINRTLTRRQTFSQKGKKTEISISSLRSAFSERKIPLSPSDVEFLAERRRSNDAYLLTGCR